MLHLLLVAPPQHHVAHHKIRSVTMAKILAPITDSSKVVIGGKYLELQVFQDVSGMLHLDAFTVLDGPHQWKSGNYRYFNTRYHSLPWDNCKKWRHTSERFFADAGLDIGPGEFDNHHRTFKDTRRNRRVLQEIVAQNNLDKYYAIIGVQKP